MLRGQGGREGGGEREEGALCFVTWLAMAHILYRRLHRSKPVRSLPGLGLTGRGDMFELLTMRGDWGEDQVTAKWQLFWGLIVTDSPDNNLSIWGFRKHFKTSQISPLQSTITLFSVFCWEFQCRTSPAQQLFMFLKISLLIPFSENVRCSCLLLFSTFYV